MDSNLLTLKAGVPVQVADVWLFCGYLSVGWIQACECGRGTDYHLYAWFSPKVSELSFLLS